MFIAFLIPCNWYTIWCLLNVDARDSQRCPFSCLKCWQYFLFRNERSKGHLGCSTGYNSKIYKPYLHKNFNSSGREQVHSVLEKLSSSLKQMNYVREAIKKILKHMQFSRSWITTLCRQITTLSYVLHSNIPRWWPNFFGSRWKNLIWKCHLYFSFGSSGCFNIHQKALTILGSYSSIFLKAFLSYMTMLRVFFGIRNIKSKNDNKFWYINIHKYLFCIMNCIEQILVVLTFSWSLCGQALDLGCSQACY